jgi:hypothetical protein
MIDGHMIFIRGGGGGLVRRVYGYRTQQLRVLIIIV